MPARTPEDAHRLWGEAYLAGDLEAMIELYEPEATWMPQPGNVVSGTDAIREHLTNFLALRDTTSFDLKPEYALRSGDLALLRARWTLKGTTPDGEPVDVDGFTADVVRRQPDGTWRYVIDDPYSRYA
jgi:uncharacterized protein (TIGR02246 family)